MTGYGKSQVRLRNGILTVELRSLNGKGADINIKCSILPKDLEISLRGRLAEALTRGTVDMFLNLESQEGGGAQSFDEIALKKHYLDLKMAAESLDSSLSESDVFKALALIRSVNLPEVAKKQPQLIGQDEYTLVERAALEAAEALKEYRRKEGEALYADVTSRTRNILSLVDEVEGFEKERLESVKLKLRGALEELRALPDASRFEQELVYYLEKLDINEEKVRLRHHCAYFLETIDCEPFPGKQLGFIIQEMGREINTTGSKANHAGIQKAVVRMKDELEKIREQCMNIL